MQLLQMRSFSAHVVFQSCLCQCLLISFYACWFCEAITREFQTPVLLHCVFNVDVLSPYSGSNPPSQIVYLLSFHARGSAKLPRKNDQMQVVPFYNSSFALIGYCLSMHVRSAELPLHTTQMQILPFFGA